MLELVQVQMVAERLAGVCDVRVRAEDLGQRALAPTVLLGLVRAGRRTSCGNGPLGLSPSTNALWLSRPKTGKGALPRRGTEGALRTV